RVINSFEKGLSKSRNLGLRNAKGKLLVIADDDEVFQPHFADTIVAGHQQFPNSVAIGFQIENTKGKLFKRYASTVKSQLHSLDLFSVLSIEISINKAILDETKVTFEERFGLGAPFEMGEEAIFLMDLYRQKRQISFVPKVIAAHEENTTTDKVDFLQRYYIQGAFLSRVQVQNFGLRLLQKVFFDVKQNKLRLTDTPKAIQQALQGRHDFLQNSQ
ncbi:MAG: glycosyltransferase, partial [Flavobacterium sp.]